MPSVKDELEELRRRSLAKAHAAKLQDANGLSTPEQEEQALKQLNDQKKVYSKDAVEILKAGSKAVDQDLEFKVQQKALKKQDLEKKKEATKNLQSFKSPVKADAAAAAAASTPTISNTSSARTSTTTDEVAKETTTEETTPVVEDVPDLDEVPDLEELETADDAGAGDLEITEGSNNLAGMAPRVANRAEKKARKVMERLGMKPVTGVSRVTLKMRGNQGFFTIYQPDVYEKSGSFVVFGEARQGTGMPQLQQQAQAAQKLATPVIDEKKVEPEVEEDEAVDESGVEAKDIELVMSQAGCSRSRAVKALKDNDGDLVNAIMSLTK